MLEGGQTGCFAGGMTESQKGARRIARQEDRQDIKQEPGQEASQQAIQQITQEPRGQKMRSQPEGQTDRK